jgi:hypothetical protein
LGTTEIERIADRTSAPVKSTRSKFSSSYRLAALMLIGAAVLGACSPGDAGDGDGPPSLHQLADDARSAGQEWQANVLDDGDVTLAEYDEAHRRVLACLDAAGLTHSEPERNIPNGYEWLYDISWQGMDEEDGSRAAQACDENNRYVALAMSAWGDWETEPALLAAVVECVTDAGFEIPADVRNYREVWLSASDQGLTREKVAACIDSGMLRLHPGVGYAIGF